MYAQFHARIVGISKSGIGLICYIDRFPLYMCTYGGITWVSVQQLGTLQWRIQDFP